MRFRDFLVLLTVVIAPQTLADEPTDKPEEAEPSVMVGAIGDLTTLEFRGNGLFEAEDLQAELRCNLKVQAACRPSAPLLPLVEQLEETLAEGYAHSGCPGTKVRVNVSEDGSHLVAHVQETPRYTAGEIRIEGVEEELAAAIRERLATDTDDIRPRPGIYFYRGEKPLKAQEIEGSEEEEDDASTDELWLKGEPVRWSKRRLANIRQEVADELAVSGYPLAKFEARLDTVDNARTDLALNVHVLGPAVTLDEIEVRGLERHTREEVLAFMGIAEGDRYDLAKLTKAYDRLTDSCRFWQHDLRLQFPATADPKDRYARYASKPRTKLVVYLIEYVHLPKLGERLDKVDETLRRSANWIREFFEQDEWDVCVRLGGTQDTDWLLKPRIDAILSPSRGLLVETSGTFTLGDRKSPFQFTALTTADQLGVTDLHHEARWSVPRPALPKLNLSLQAAGSSQEEFKSRFMLGIGLTSDKDATICDISVSPVVWVHNAHRKGAQCETVDGKLIIKEQNTNLKIDIVTGRIIEMVAWDGNGGLCTITPVRHADGRFQDQLAVVNALPNRYQKGHPFRSMLVWGLQIGDQLPTAEPVLPIATKRLLEQLVDSDLLREWEDGIDDRKEEKERNEAWEFQLAEGIPASDLSLDNIFPWGAAAADPLFVRDTWPWTLTREAAFYCAELDPEWQVAEEELSRLLDRTDTGPIAYWCMQRLGFVNHEAAPFGLQKLTDGTFEREVAMITTPDTGMMKVLKHAVPLVQSLPEEDTAWLCDFAGEELSPALQETCRLLRKLDAESDETLQASLAELLRGDVREMVEADLRRATAPQVAEEPSTEMQR